MAALTQTSTRLAVIDPDRCKPKTCRQECRKICPVVAQGKLCIEVTPASSIATISEGLCTGCNLCAKRCPFNAISIINLPHSLATETVHRYGSNGFKLHRLPVPRPGKVLGLVGANGTGKSTALKILANKLQANLGQHGTSLSPTDIITHFRGSELQGYFTRLYDTAAPLTATYKMQFVDALPRLFEGTVSQLLAKLNNPAAVTQLVRTLELEHVLDQNLQTLSGGELQRLAVTATCARNSGVYLFDEATSYLDVAQRLQVANVIRQCLSDSTYVIVVEHDLTILDYLSDHVCCLYGQAGAYGVVTVPYSVREGINIFLDGYIPTENMRFRPTSLSFRLHTDTTNTVVTSTTTTSTNSSVRYPTLTKSWTNFSLTITAGQFDVSSITVLLGPNGCGKTTFVRMLAGLASADVAKSSTGTGVDSSGESAGVLDIPQLNISYKPQKLQAVNSELTVRQLLQAKVWPGYCNHQLQTDVVKPLMIEPLLDLYIKNLSGGELQRVALAVCLLQPADVYLIDEPSAYLDAEQRVVVGKMLKHFIVHSGKRAIVVEHDFLLATYLADSVIVYSPNVTDSTIRSYTASAPQSLLTGMNTFLQNMQVTFRRDATNYQPRINKLNSTKDQEQKASGNYFVPETDDD